MKFSTILTVFALSLAFATVGCKYNKAARGSGADGLDGSDIATDEIALEDVKGGDNFEDIYQKCTDVDFAPVYFSFDSTVVPQEELTKIEAVASHLKDNSDRVVVVAGHCDERGSNEYNLSLGENRAVIIRNYLINNDIASERIQTRTFGEEQPAVEGHDESAWCKNRRGEFGIYKK